MAEQRPFGTADTLAGLATQTDPNLDTARVVGGRYRILGLLGSGGMGTVYRARDQELDELVALKLLRRELVDTPGMLARFRQEVKLARRVTHINVARVFDIGEDGSDKFLTMEYVEGEPLSAAIARRGALPLDEVRGLGRALCEGLTAAHAAGVIHRDLKPDNILLGAGGRVVITDFGIARLYQDSADRTQGGILGTPAYMAPEQVEGSEVDQRADLYALGAVLFELVCGERAWRGESMLAVAAARLTQPPPDPRHRAQNLPAPLAEVIVRCLARGRDQRYAGAAELAAALETAFDSITRWTPLPQVAPPSLPSRNDKSVAVLPFRNAGPREEDYLAEGLTEDLIDTLSMTRGLRVRPHSVVARVREQGGDPRVLGQALDVQVVIEGSLRKSGDRTRVSARAIHVTDGFQIWAHRVDAAPGELLVVSDGMAHAIATALTAELGASARAPVNPLAIDLYLRARHELRAAWNDDPREAVAQMEKAVALAPGDANIVASHALGLSRIVFIFGGAAASQAALTAAERAVAAAPDSGESWAALSNARMYRGSATEAAEALRTGLRRAPTSGHLHEISGRMQLEVGLLDEGQVHLEAAMRLDPSLSEVPWILARLWATRGEWDRADALFEQFSYADAAFVSAAIQRARLSLWRGRPFAVPPDLAQRAHTSKLLVRLLELAAEAQKSGVLDDQQATLIAGVATADRRRLSAFLWQMNAELAGALGDTPRALSAVAHAVDNDLIDVVWLSHCPALAIIRAHPSYAELLARVEAKAAPIRAVLKGV